MRLTGASSAGWGVYSPLPMGEGLGVRENLPAPRKRVVKVRENLPAPRKRVVKVGENLPAPRKRVVKVRENFPSPRRRGAGGEVLYAVQSMACRSRQIDFGRHRLRNWCDARRYGS